MLSVREDWYLWKYLGNFVSIDVHELTPSEMTQKRRSQDVACCFAQHGHALPLSDPPPPQSFVRLQGGEGEAYPLLQGGGGLNNVRWRHSCRSCCRFFARISNIASCIQSLLAIVL